MADTLQFDLVSPERRLASVRATQVRIPGADGEFTAMPGHAPFLTTLRPGVVVVQAEGGEARYAVTGGFAEVGAAGVSVLAERSVPAAEMTQRALDALVAEARAVADKDAAQKLVSDLGAMAADLGLTVPSG